MHTRRGKTAASTVFLTLITTTGLTSTAAVASSVDVPIEIVAHTTGSISDFESTIAGCDTGSVADTGVHANLTPWGGVFNGDKAFTCANGGGGFTLRLKARFGQEGSSGTWVVVDGWGVFADVKGTGTLIGTRIGEAQIDDVYTGTFR